MRPRPILPALVFVAACVWLRPSIQAETTDLSGAVAITSVPCTISQPGTYYLAQDLSNNGATDGIVITAANVTLDLNGHTFTRTDALSNYTNGIDVYADNVTVHNGTVANYAYGLFCAGTGCRFENLTFSQVNYCGIRSQTPRNIIRGCRIVNTGGSTYGPLGGYAFGIQAAGDDNVVIDCDIAGVTAPGGIGAGIMIWGNNAMVVGNRLSGCPAGIFMGNASIKYRDNLCTADISLPYTASWFGFTGGTDAGNNN